MLLEELSGVDVAVIDDTYREVESILDELKKRDIKNEYLNVDYAGNAFDHPLITTIKLIFLDLNYNNSYGARFDAEFCVTLISRIVPPGKQYYLVTWTKDPENTEEVIEILKERDLAPISYTSKKKEDFRISDNGYDIERLFKELDTEFEQIQEVVDFWGEIIEVEENSVLINCLVDKGRGVFQIRRFDKGPFVNHVDLKEGNYITIRTITKPGSRLFEYNNHSGDLSSYFVKKDYFKGLENTAFFKDE